MPQLDDLANLVSENPQVREDLIATLSAFCERHGIPVSAADFTWDDAGGHTIAAPEPSRIFMYRDGPSYTRFVDTGIKAGPGVTQQYDIRGSTTT
jgi:hypothetical protein